jgi:beta-glucosidase-like glycosyl hydrolase
MSKFISIFILFFLLLNFSFIYAGTRLNHVETDTSRTSWSDSVLTSLSLEEKIAQLMMIRTYSNKDKAYYDRVEETIKKYNIGGLCFFQGGPVMQAKLTNRYQATAKTPLLISMDAEWGLGMRLDSAFSFPYQMTLGAIRDNGLIYEMATEIARQLKLLGVHINFAPVADVNNNPANPVINSRSFGESQMEVTEKSIAYMKGLQENGMIATAKHFPGHGDTDSDSHYTLPVIRHSRQRLDSVELYPFQQLINAGLDAVMIAHLFVTNLDSTKNTPTTLSKAVVTDLLRTEMGFEGLIITDALDMKGATSSRKPGEIELEAFLAGNDILLLPQDVNAAITEIMNAVNSGLVPEEMINERCSRVLRFKQKAGLDNYVPALMDSLYEKLNSVNNELISRKIYEAAVTVIKNESNILPLSHLDTLKIAALSIGSPEITPFQNMLGNYSKIDFYNILSTFTVNQAAAMIEKLTPYNLIIISLHNTNIFSNKNFGLTPQTFKLIDKIAEKEKVILTLFANPYSLSGIIRPDQLASIIIGYQDNRISNEITAQVIMGSIDAGGRLPVLISDTSFFQSGININSIQRLKYSIPEEVGIAAGDLGRIDSIALSGIRHKATPG